MGWTGETLCLERLVAVEPTEVPRVRSDVINWLGKVWDDLLREPYSRLAWGWVSEGVESLLEVDVRASAAGAPELIFRCYGSVDWPADLAQHWLSAALAYGRRSLEPMLARHGYRLVIAPEDAPGGLERAFYGYRGRRFFGHEGRIGCWKGDTIVWQPAQGVATPINEAALAAGAREAAERLQRDGRCLCPLCVNLDASFLPREASTVPPITLARLASVRLRDEQLALVARGEGRWLVVLKDAFAGLGITFAWTTDGGGSWQAVPMLADRTRKADWVAWDRRTGTLVAWFARAPNLSPGSGDDGFFVSTDLGATFHRFAPEGLPNQGEARFRVARGTPADVWAEVAHGEQKRYYASGDAGRTFRDVGRGFGDGRMLVDIARAAADPTRMVAISERDDVQHLWSSGDGGMCWKYIKLPPNAQPQQVVAGVGVGVLGVFVDAEQGEDEAQDLPTGTTLYRSTDGGQTWTQHHLGGHHQAAAVLADGRWYWSTVAGLATSTDDGVTFAACGNFGPNELGVDGGETWFVAGGTLGVLRAP